MRRIAMLALLFACETPATLTHVQEQVFTPSCALSTCHGAAGGGTGELNLTDGNSHASLVDQPAENVSNERCPVAGQDTDITGRTDIRVVPGDPEASYLVQKLRGDPDIIGSPMPECEQGLATTDPDLFDLVVRWIANGALDD